MEMNFIKQICRFDELSIGNLTPTAIAIYYHLFHVNNRCGWREWFEESDLWIEQAVGIKRRETVLSAINLLKQKGFIDFERGGTHKPTKYKIIPLFNSANNSAFNSAFNSGIDSAFNSANNSAFNSDNPKHKTKTKTKTKTNNKRAQFVAPTLDEVNEYILEKGLHVSAKDFYDYFDAGNWIDSKGNHVQNWKQKLLTWEKYHTSTPQKKSRLQENMEAADRAIAFFEQEAKNNDEGSGYSKTSEAVYGGVPF